MENIQSKVWFSDPFVPLFGSKNTEKMLLQLTSNFLQLESTISICMHYAVKTLSLTIQFHVNPKTNQRNESLTEWKCVCTKSKTTREKLKAVDIMNEKTLS
jgi:hypothetical protein